ncbi:type II toxin-antitoxin system VapC family toxin [Nostoc sp. FACHB-888]|uniref:type II toxin-antitoxin system VapC family toxin n=1 Tax=Nostoc sp. FACHB-888 TaxID=2692842 RepID=UPI0032206CB2
MKELWLYLLDTNACIVYLNRPISPVRQRLESLSPADIVVCSVVKAELFYGAMRSNNPTRTLALQEAFLNNFVSLPFDDRASRIFGTIRAELGMLGLVHQLGLMISPVMIACLPERSIPFITSAEVECRPKGIVGAISSSSLLRFQNVSDRLELQ